MIRRFNVARAALYLVSCVFLGAITALATRRPPTLWEAVALGVAVGGGLFVLLFSRR